MSPLAKPLVSSCLAVLLTSGMLAAQSRFPGVPGPTPAAPVVVPADVALGSLMTLSDGYLKRLADSLTLFASTDQARSAEWERIRTPLAAVAERNVTALVWFALPDGSYWSVQQGASSGNLSDRPYFIRVLAGETVIGPLVVSKATGRCSAIVAVPVTTEGVVVGVLGGSVYLDELSARLVGEMAVGADMIFYSFDRTPLLALEWDPQLIFVDPLSLGPEVRAAFEYMLSRNSGTVRYRWANRWRTVLFRQSTVTGWWYAFGVVGAPNAAVGPR